ncbi:Vitamin B12 transporter BtuB [Alphaproteobacteria bacterium SO-S41]|nr:Vitamin B12 transporter BtuB [Alphaproteobacteria bacterium SO-S41]
MAQDTAPAAAPSGEEEITVTAQRKAEKLQKVPIAVSAFGQDQLQKQKIDGGPNLVLAVPNVNFSKGNFTGANFQIRGIGSKLVAASGDAATGVHINNAPMTANNLFETEFYDVERVEVLRGPQGTLYGRNATGGVVNIITAKPKIDQWEAMGRVEYGDYDSVKLKGMVNVPLGDMAALRLAGTYLKRGGFGENTVTGNDADDRLLYGLRATLFVQPTDDFSFYIMYDHFNEDDNRSRIGKQFCSKDTGPANVGGVAYSAAAGGLIGQVQRGFFSQGCRPTSLYDPTALGTVQSQSTLGGLFGALGGFQTGDAYVGKMQDPNVRNIESAFDPTYQSNTDIWEFNADWDITDSLRLSALGTYTTFDLFTRQDYNRYSPSTNFNTTPNPVNAFAALGPAYATIYANLFPNGTVNDPQVGAQNRYTTMDISSAYTKQYTAELRLSSSYDGPFNFSIGANYLKLDATGDYYVMGNTLTAYYQVNNFLNTGNANCYGAAPCVSIDPNADPDRTGRNYYDAYSPYNLKSTAIFGEVYYQVTDDLKLTGGVRYTIDEKTIENHAVGLGVAGVGIPAPLPGIPATSTVEFKEFTGRVGFDWAPDIGADSTLVYGFYSRGYKAGGLNSPCSGGAGVICGAPTFKPEFINAYEIGTKNTFMGGAAQLNLSIFHYDYEGYQVSKIVNRASTNENIDAKISGAEFEGVYSPVEGLRFNLNVGYLDTEIAEGTSSIDTFNRTASNPLLTVVKSSAASNCVVTTAAAAQALAISNAGGNPFALLGVCTVTNFATAGQALLPGGPVAQGSNAFGALVSDGVVADLSGHELPNAPHWTISFGAQYTFNLSPTWEMTIRGDYYKQTETFSRIWNASYDRIEGWENVNVTLTLANVEQGVTLDAYVKNATDEEAITDSYLTDDSSGLFRNAFFTDPRTWGVAITVNY